MPIFRIIEPLHVHVTSLLGASVTHSMQLIKVVQICENTDNLRAIQILLDSTIVDSAARYLCVNFSDTLTTSEGVEMQLEGPTSRSDLAII